MFVEKEMKGISGWLMVPLLVAAVGGLITLLVRAIEAEDVLLILPGSWFWASRSWGSSG